MGRSLIYLKKLAKDARFQDLLNFYSLITKKNKINSKDILLKEKSLRGMMEPYNQTEFQLSKNAGFNDYMTVYQNINFVGILAIK